MTEVDIYSWPSSTVHPEIKSQLPHQSARPGDEVSECRKDSCNTAKRPSNGENNQSTTENTTCNWENPIRTSENAIRTMENPIRTSENAIYNQENTRLARIMTAPGAAILTKNPSSHPLLK